jgi:hypothetical protein
MVQAADAVGRDQACYDDNMEAALLAKRARWDFAISEGQACRGWEEGRHDRDRQKIVSMASMQRQTHIRSLRLRTRVGSPMIPATLTDRRPLDATLGQ